MAAYEALRQAVLDRRPAHAQSHALALFVRQGMLSWMTVWSHCRAVQIPRHGAGPAEPGTVVTNERGAEVVRLLAEIVLVRARGDGGGGG